LPANVLQARAIGNAEIGASAPMIQKLPKLNMTKMRIIVHFDALIQSTAAHFEMQNSHFDKFLKPQQVTNFFFQILDLCIYAACNTTLK
jgi:hypothetical protein